MCLIFSNFIISPSNVLGLTDKVTKLCYNIVEMKNHMNFLSAVATPHFVSGMKIVYAPTVLDASGDVIYEAVHRVDRENDAVEMAYQYAIDHILPQSQPMMLWLVSKGENDE